MKVKFYYLILVAIIFCGCGKMPITPLTEKSSATESGTVVQPDNDGANRRILSGGKKIWMSEDQGMVQGLSFSDDGKFNWTIINAKTGEEGIFSGNYEVSGANLIFNVDKKSGGGSVAYHFSLENVARLYLGEGENRVHFYLYGSIEDPHLNDPEPTEQPATNYPAPNWDPEVLRSQYDASHENNVQVQRSETCYTCHGTGRCVVCSGSGNVSGYGHTSQCTACNGTGVCWHCHGSGVQ